MAKLRFMMGENTILEEISKGYQKGFKFGSSKKVPIRFTLVNE
jgi:hypothetical protein